MLRRKIADIGKEAGAEEIAAAFYDYESETSWSYHGDRWFHAASTIKVAVLVGLFRAIEKGRFHPEARLHVRNRFLSAAGGEPFRVSSSRDANAEVHEARGKAMKVRELAHHMIVTSSNLATNLLVDLLGVEPVAGMLEELDVQGVELKRGVEDERAFEAGLNNRVTAHGLLRLFQRIQDRERISEAAAQQMLDILFAQEFNSGIPAGLPDSVRKEARIAHKTGEISTVAHDAGLVFLPDRKPYALAILTGWEPSTSGRRETIAAISRAIYEYITMGDEEKDGGGEGDGG